MTSENTYEDKKQEESVTREVTPEERPFSTQEYWQRAKELFEESGTWWLGTSSQARKQRALNGEPPASNDSMNISAIIGGGPPRRS